MGEEGLITSHTNYRSFLLAVPTVDQRIWRIGFYLLIHWGGLFRTWDHRQSRSEDIRHNRCLTLITMALVPGTITWRHYNSFLFPPNVDLHTCQQQHFLYRYPLYFSAIILVCWLGFQFHFSSDNHRSFSPGNGYFRWVSLATWSDRGAELWGSWGSQGTLAAPQRMGPYPNSNASPRVRYTDLELDSDLTLGNGD